MDQTASSSGEGKAKRPLHKSPWFWPWMILGAISLIVAIFQAANGYYFPCTLSGNITGYFPCEASSSARWIAAIREGAKGLCGLGCCGGLVLGVIWVLTQVVKSKVKQSPTESDSGNSPTSGPQA